MQDFLTAVSNFGFPVVVAGYLLFRFENKIEKLTLVIEDLKTSMDLRNIETKNLANKINTLSKRIK